MASGPKQDVSEEFASLVLPDQRLVQRIQGLVQAVAASPSSSLPMLLEDVAGGLLGAYRVLNNERVTPQALGLPHRERAKQRCLETGSIVVIHDPTDVHTRWIDPSEMGYLSTGKPGYSAHVSLAVSVQPDRPVQPLGVLNFEPFFHPKPSRRGKRASGAETARRKNKAYERWQRGVEVTGQALQDCPSVVHVMDRAADCYPLFAQIEDLQQGFVTRLRVDRRARQTEDDVDDELAWTSLGELATKMIGVCTRDVPLSKRGAKRAPASLKTHPPRESRHARLKFSAMMVDIARPRYLSDGPQSLSLGFVRVWEPNPPEGEQAVEWLLITNEPCETPEQIMRVVDLYRCRWIIEEFFKALKTGCALEERQFESRHALLNIATILLPIAVHLLWIRACARDTPDAPATDVLTPLQLTVLRHRARRRMPDSPSARDALWVLAGLGGHIPNNGWPGWQVLGRAFEKLLEATHVWKLATNALAPPQTPGAEM